jgi:hypothetical protein
MIASHLSSGTIPTLEIDLGDVRIREITGTEFFPLAFPLRYEVWKDEAELTATVRTQKVITDEHDEHARHWAAFDACETVASARMCIHRVQDETPDAATFKEIVLPAPIATINRLVVKKEWRHAGLARQFDVRRVEAAREASAACAVGTAFDWRVASLQACGFELTEYRWTMPYMEFLLGRGMILIF